jgi:hypothetical protein
MQNKTTERGERLVWLEPNVVSRLGALRGPIHHPPLWSDPAAKSCGPLSPKAMLDKGRDLSSATLARQPPFRQLAKDLSGACAFRRDAL